MGEAARRKRFEADMKRRLQDTDYRAAVLAESVREIVDEIVQNTSFLRPDFVAPTGLPEACGDIMRDTVISGKTLLSAVNRIAALCDPVFESEPSAKSEAEFGDFISYKLDGAWRQHGIETGRDFCALLDRVAAAHALNTPKDYELGWRRISWSELHPDAAATAIELGLTVLWKGEQPMALYINAAGEYALCPSITDEHALETAPSDTSMTALQALATGQNERPTLSSRRLVSHGGTPR